MFACIEHKKLCSLKGMANYIINNTKNNEIKESSLG